MTRLMCITAFVAGGLAACMASGSQAGQDDNAALQKEVRGKGWVAYSALGENRTWDLFLSRPDGSHARNIAQTANFDETGVRFSPNGLKMLYRRIRHGSREKSKEWGSQGSLVIANSDGTNPVVVGEEGAYSWAVWSPDGKRIAYLNSGDIEVIELKEWEVAFKEAKEGVRKIPGAGIEAELNWSADGKWFYGVRREGASPRAIRVNAATGQAAPFGEAVGIVFACFPPSGKVLCTYRSTKEDPKSGRLCIVDGEGRSPQLVYAEEHDAVAGGALSPDGRYILIAKGTPAESESETSSRSLLLMRVSDSPIIIATSQALRKAHPDAKEGPVLRLGSGWGVSWTDADVMAAEDPRVAQLAAEVRDKGWIVYSARSENGSWDLFRSRPDGLQRQNLTNTPSYHEAAPVFSRDYKKMLYRRIDGGASIPGATYGFQEGRLVMADADGSNPKIISEPGQYPWATWAPDSKQIACVYPKGIQIINLATMKVVREMPRKGLHGFLTYSPDGQWFCGTGNWGGGWGIVRMNIETGELNGVQTGPACTCDWHPDSGHIVCSSRPPGQDGPDSFGWTQSILCDGDGKSARLLYGEDGYHTYGSGFSPDGKYLIFTKCAEDNSGREGAPLYVMRMADTPTITGESKLLRKKYPDAKNGAVLFLAQGWEPVWTFQEMGGRQ